MNAATRQFPTAAEPPSTIDENAVVEQKARAKTGLIVGDDGKRHHGRYINGVIPFHPE